ncbi:MAG TPA: ATP-binding cassette domain-containing protein, partial [Gammaproteobacteria bacterium]|nr:ATP-binding cassette domain-containing protein [Gammaproteobacteria bacterium]
ILGLSPVSGGRLEVFGRSMPEEGRQVRARLGVVPQGDNLDPDFTVAENLAVYGSYFGLSRATLQGRIGELLDFVELGDRAHSRTEALSGGMKRRLTIARALINDPEVVVLDEPTTGLDPQVRHMIWQRLRALIRQGKTLLLTTHYMEEAERLCDELVVMDQGRIMDHGSPAELVARHVEPQVLEIRAEPEQVGALVSPDAGCRVETVGDTVYCYTHDARPLMERLQDAGTLIYLHRPANLEDVFLKLTGHELRD